MKKKIEIRKAGNQEVIGHLNLEDAEIRGQDGRGRTYIRFGGSLFDVYFDGAIHYVCV